MLTGRGTSLLIAAVVAWLAGRTLGITALYVLAVAAAATVGLGVAYVRATTSQLSARRLVDTRRVVAGGRIGVRLQLRNDAHLPSPTLLVDDELPEGLAAASHDAGPARFVVGDLAPGRVVELPYDVLALTRGRYRIGPVQLRLRDPFGIAERVRRFAATDDVVIYPRIEPLPAGGVRGAHMGAGASQNRRVFATGEEFYTMREYVNGDDLRHVHWASTAHRQQLMVRQMEQPWQAHATVFLDSRRSAHTTGPDGTLEKAVSAAASLVYHLADRGYALRLVTEASVSRSLPVPWDDALDHLAVLAASANPSLAPALGATRGSEGLFVAVLGVVGGRDAERDRSALLGVRGFGHRVAIVVGPHSGDAGEAHRTLTLLRRAGWRAVHVGPSQPLAPAWQEVSGPVTRTGAAGVR